MRIYQVNPANINLHEVPSARDVAHQKRRLLAEGQIEPITISPVTMLANLDQCAYADAQVTAARELGWSTLLVTY
jgi:hypothetical protein